MTDLADFEVLSFDCYGTLIDWEAGISAVLGPWARSHDPAITDEDVLDVFAGHESRVERERPTAPYLEVLREVFRRVGATLGHPVTDAEAERFGRSVPDWPAFPDSSDALNRLKKHYRLVILSNVDRASFAASNERLGVEFDAVLTAEDIGSYKPDPANFAALTRRVSEMGGNGRLAHVAQSLFHDHVPAQAAGLPTVWIDRRHSKPGWGATPAPGVGVTPDLAFPSMAAFADAADQALGAA